MVATFLKGARERWAWLIALGARAMGAGSLAGAWAVGLSARLRVVAVANGQVGPGVLLRCLLAVLLLSLGLALLIEGRGLFRDVPRPPRPLLP